MKPTELYQWQITPEEEGYSNIRAFLLLISLLLLFIITVFFETTNNNDTSLFSYVLDLLTNEGRWSKHSGMFFVLQILVLFSVIVGAFFVLSKRAHSRYSEKYTITSLGITIINHNNIAKNHFWSSFKGFFKIHSYGGGPVFYLVKKGAIMTFPYQFYPSVMVRGKEDNVEEINKLLNQFIPQFSKQELRKRWYFTAAFFMIIVLAVGLIIGFIAKKLNLI